MKICKTKNSSWINFENKTIDNERPLHLVDENLSVYIAQLLLLAGLQKKLGLILNSHHFIL